MLKQFLRPWWKLFTRKQVPVSTRRPTSRTGPAHTASLRLEELETRVVPATFFSDLTAATGGSEAVSGSTWLAGEFTTDNATYNALTATLLLDQSSAGTAELDLYTDGGLQP